MSDLANLQRLDLPDLQAGATFDSDAVAGAVVAECECKSIRLVCWEELSVGEIETLSLV